MPSIRFLNTGALQTYTIPSGISSMQLKVWGAAGGPRLGFGSAAGAGGFSSGIVDVNQGQILQIMTGSVGIANTGTTSFGGGGAGGLSPSGFRGASGGGRSGVAFLNQTQFIIAGGGGGASPGSTASVNLGGNGGGLTGNAQTIVTGGANITPAGGGTQTAGGAGGISSVRPAVNGFAGSSLAGGTGGSESTGSGGGGGGGGGFFGGGGGIGAGSGDSPSEQAGGGGSGFLDTILRSGVSASTPQGTTQSIVNPPNTSDPDYIAGVGVANGAAGTGNGLVVLVLPDLSLNKTVNERFTTTGNVLDYVISIRNSGPGTLSNVRFLDTIPAATTLVSGSFNQDGTSISGSPISPGVTLPNAILENQVTTITFSVLVSGTLPNPIRNQAISSYGDGLFSYISNQVTTTINFATLSSSKQVNRSFANIGDILTYTIPIRNNGNTTVNNIVFLDTIPDGTSLITNSFRQDGTVISGSSNPPGVTLPNNLGINRTTTVTFQVRVVSNPNPNPIPNSASLSSTFIIDPSTVPNRLGGINSNTNIVNTSVNYANLGNITKFVDKSFANCGDVITYTIVAPNSGTVTAQNVVFKDTIPNGTVLVANSVTVNGATQTGANPNTGVTIPNIGPGATATLIFQVKVTC